MKKLLIVGVFALFASLVSCGGGGGDDESSSKINASSQDVVVFAWNDLGMHCINPTFDSAVILPPYNNLVVQVVRRGAEPEILTEGVTVSYSILNNTTSQKTATNNGYLEDFRQFWQNALALFGVALDQDKGLNLSDAGVSNGLSGQMVAVGGDHFEAVGIPVTPLDDDLNWDPYQVAKITVKDLDGNILAETRATVPVSDEINCSKCHGPGKVAADFITVHNNEIGTELPTDAPFLCADCHASPALGVADRITVNIGNGPQTVPYLSEAIHNFHGNLEGDSKPSCYDCHPGDQTQCNRSLRHTGADGNCTECHGTLAQVGQSITDGRVPWVTEPKCSDCHSSGIYQVDTGSTLYRNAKGHGGIACAACHGSPHAMIPSREASDNYQAEQYQSASVTIGSCGACHGSSKGEGASEFLEEHGSGGRKSACNVCHTSVQGGTTSWPHKFQWTAR